MSTFFTFENHYKFNEVLVQAFYRFEPERNSRKTEIPYIHTLEYAFQYSRTSIKFMHILAPFWSTRRRGRGVNFDFSAINF